MTEPGAPLSFFQSFLRTLDDAYVAIGARTYFPIVFVTTSIVPIGILLIFRELDRPFPADSFSMILAATMTVEGILASVSISAMVQIQQIASQYPFSDYLKQEKLFDSFIFAPQFAFVTQCLAAFACVISLLLTPFGTELEMELVVICMGLFVYALIKTLGLVDMIRTLSWHYASYQIFLEEAKSTGSS